LIVRHKAVEVGVQRDSDCQGHYDEDDNGDVRLYRSFVSSGFGHDKKAKKE
jgi:hypothetical protein